MNPPSKTSESIMLWAHRVLMPILTLLITAAISIMAWVGNQVWGEARSWMRELDGRVSTLEIKDAKMDASKFTTGDWAQAKARMDEDRANLDRRITRLEEAVPAIKETLMRIENKIDKIHTP